MIYLAALLAIAALRMAIAGGPQFLNDSYQYLSIADHLGRERSISTSFVHFDAERASGRLPAPESTFPPGYPILFWLVSWTGLPLPWAALLVSLSSVLAVLPLLRSAAGALRLTGGATRFCLVSWTFNAQVALWGITLYTEAVFTAVNLAAWALLLRDAREKRAASWRVPIAYLLTGAAVWIRYAGLFLVVALHAYALLQLVRDRARWRTWLAAPVLCDALVGLLLVRNAALTGSWSGGHSDHGHHSVGSLLYRLGAAGYALAFGSHQRPLSLPFGPLMLLTVTAGVAGSIWALRELASGRRTRAPGHRDQHVLLLSTFALYCGAMSYLGMRSNISLDARMFLPILPVALLLAALVLELRPARTSRVHASVLAALTVGYVGTNISSDLQPPGLARHEMVAEMMALPTPDGEPLSHWIRSTVPRDAVLFATEGQATGYLLDRKTISAVGRLFTSRAWDEGDVRREMTRFGAEYLILYPEAVASGSNDGLDSAFLRRLAAKRAPAWLDLAAENPRVLVYRRRPDEALP